MKTTALVLTIVLGLGTALALAGEFPGPAAPYPQADILKNPQKATAASGAIVGYATRIQSDTLKNPVEATPASLAKGKALFSKSCASCHGAKGNGDSPVGKAFNPPARNLTDTTWQHRYTDGQIFTVIAEGIPGSGMVPFEKSIKEGNRWNLVNYIRTLKVKEVKAVK